MDSCYDCLLLLSYKVRQTPVDRAEEDVESVGIKFSRDVSGDFSAVDSRVEMIGQPGRN